MLIIITAIIFFFLGKYSSGPTEEIQKYTKLASKILPKEPITFHNPRKNAENKEILNDIQDV